MTYLFFTLHIHSRDGEESILSTRQQNLGTPVLRTIELEISHPAFFESLTGEVA